MTLVVSRYIGALGRVIIAVALIVALVGGAGIAAADGEDNSGKECPEENPNEGREHASGTGHERSTGGFLEAYESTECATEATAP